MKLGKSLFSWKVDNNKSTRLEIKMLRCHVFGYICSNMAMFGQRFKLCNFFIFLLSLGLIFSTLMTGVMSSDISSCYKVWVTTPIISHLTYLWSRLTRSGVTPHCWVPSLLSRTMRSVRLSAGWWTKMTFTYYVEISRTRSGARVGPGYQRPVLSTQTTAWCSPTSEISKTIPTVSGRKKDYKMSRTKINCLLYLVDLWVVCAAMLENVKIPETIKWTFLQILSR